MKTIFSILFAASIILSFGIEAKAPAEINKIAASVITEKEAAAEAEYIENKNLKEYILNTRSYKIHRLDCFSVERMASHNKKQVKADIEDLKKEGYKACKNCYPK